mmetsp:Transcript_128052/g.362461  ORF Transcript_128052/g.362461 Transcript_128052/m.362461 type:complete len:240 (+) Transcript_128052:1474-2193(+)
MSLPLWSASSTRPAPGQCSSCGGAPCAAPSTCQPWRRTSSAPGGGCCPGVPPGTWRPWTAPSEGGAGLGRQPLSGGPWWTAAYSGQSALWVAVQSRRSRGHTRSARLSCSSLGGKRRSADTKVAWKGACVAGEHDACLRRLQRGRREHCLRTCSQASSRARGTLRHSWPWAHCLPGGTSHVCGGRCTRGGKSCTARPKPAMPLPWRPHSTRGRRRSRRGGQSVGMRVAQRMHWSTLPLP